MSDSDTQLDWFRFLDARLQVAVQEAVAGGNDPDDALRGLYISDEQALAMAASGGSPAPVALSFAAESRASFLAFSARAMATAFSCSMRWTAALVAGWTHADVM